MLRPYGTHESIMQLRLSFSIRSQDSPKASVQAKNGLKTGEFQGRGRLRPRRPRQARRVEGMVLAAQPLDRTNLAALSDEAHQGV